ncbi:unnamed protein product [Onchocerca ochengi]|uniref:DUF1758 domain-containing protein n=1 Tax=Onchocerca ochengi TaxID=42157 RepID=A0A182EPL3_ONCOC|nr:unnamed protein product [Onchocerca ochengi]
MLTQREMSTSTFDSFQNAKSKSNSQEMKRMTIYVTAIKPRGGQNYVTDQKKEMGCYPTSPRKRVSEDFIEIEKSSQEKPEVDATTRVEVSSGNKTYMMCKEAMLVNSYEREKPEKELILLDSGSECNLITESMANKLVGIGTIAQLAVFNPVKPKESDWIMTDTEVGIVRMDISENKSSEVAISTARNIGV